MRGARPLSERIKANSRRDRKGCWLWQGSLDRDGYGRISVRPESGTGASLRKAAHRVSYEAFVGPIPDGMTIDHTCRTRACVNPAHFELVPLVENIARRVYVRANHRNAAKTHCKNGHEFTAENTRIGSRGDRICRACERARGAASDAVRRKRTAA